MTNEQLRERVGHLVQVASRKWHEMNQDTTADAPISNEDHAMCVGGVVVAAVVKSLLDELPKMNAPVLAQLDELRETVLDYDASDDKRGEEWDEFRQRIDKKIAAVRAEVLTVARWGTQ
jgi:hypothetical protein